MLEGVGKLVDEVVGHLRIDEISSGHSTLGDWTGEDAVFVADIDLEL